MASIRNRPLPVSPGPSICRRAPTVKSPQSRPLRRAPSWLSVRAKTSDATPSAAPDTQWRPVLRTTNKQHRIKLVEIHHMECLNQLCASVRPSDGAATADRRAEPGAGSRRRRGAFPADVSCHVNHQLKNILSGKIIPNAICFVFYSP